MNKVLHSQTKRFQDRLSYSHRQNDFNDYELIEEREKEGVWRGVIWGLFLAMFLYLFAVAILSL